MIVGNTFYQHKDILTNTQKKLKVKNHLRREETLQKKQTKEWWEKELKRKKMCIYMITAK